MIHTSMSMMSYIIFQIHLPPFTCLRYWLVLTGISGSEWQVMRGITLGIFPQPEMYSPSASLSLSQQDVLKIRLSASVCLACVLGLITSCGMLPSKLFRPQRFSVPPRQGTLRAFPYLT